MASGPEPSDRRATAYHEAGHAAAAWWKYLSFREVSIIPDDREGTLGHLRHGQMPRWFHPDTERDCRHITYVEKRVLVSLAGLEAELRFRGRHNWAGASRDLAAAMDCLDWLSGSSEETEARLDLAHVQARKLFELAPIWQAVEALADSLLVRKRLSGDEAVTVMREAAGLPRQRTMVLNVSTL